MAPTRRTRGTVWTITAAALLLPVGAALAAEQVLPPGGELMERDGPLADATPATSDSETEAAATDEDDDGGVTTAMTPTQWKLRAKVKRRPGKRFGGPRKIGPAFRKVRDASCRHTKRMLGSGEPRAIKVRLRMFRTQGAPDQTRTRTPKVRCQKKHQRISAFTLQAKTSFPKVSGGRTTRGPMRLQKGLRLAARQANRLADDVVEQGKRPRFTVKIIQKPKGVQGMIVGLARRYGLDIGKALAVARCESGLNPRAHNPAGYGGVYQQPYAYWSRRARFWGHPGASIYDPYANIDVTLRAVKHQGWVGWGCA